MPTAEAKTSPRREALDLAALPPFYLIDEVAQVRRPCAAATTATTAFDSAHTLPRQGSPASRAGARVGDKVVKFGPLTKATEARRPHSAGRTAGVLTRTSLRGTSHATRCPNSCRQTWVTPCRSPCCARATVSSFCL
jgi:hypothetical protein